MRFTQIIGHATIPDILFINMDQYSKAVKRFAERLVLSLSDQVFHIILIVFNIL